MKSFGSFGMGVHSHSLPSLQFHMRSQQDHHQTKRKPAPREEEPRTNSASRRYIDPNASRHHFITRETEKQHKTINPREESQQKN
mmetsp:Transcript_30161/g.61232  ORF Transcript_30161/g.61232 Transcript_30161/m.61232 type:complete len:85 (-) Transcript_30161:994-1248(-)